MTKKLLRQSVKWLVKRGLQHIAARFGRHVRSGDPQLLILMYHRILPADDPRVLNEEPGMIVTPETFRLHLGVILEHFKVIHLSEWTEILKNKDDLSGNYCSITFDDGWVDNYEFAYPILQELGVPATIFTVSEMVGTNRLFWPERLSQLINTIAIQHPELWADSSLSWINKLPVDYDFNAAKPSREQLSEIIAQVKSLTDQEIHKRLDRIERILPIQVPTHRPLLLDWQQINEMTGTGLVEIGSHTCRHIRLNDQISDDMLRHEVSMSKQQIETQTNQPVKHFCFPNGDYSTTALTHVRSHYEMAVTTDSGWNSTETDLHQLRRIGIHEDISNDKTAFLARISGWM